MIPRHTIRVVTLGCAKNTVDSEVLMGQLKLNNIKVLKEGEKGKADTVIINTCGFIHDAKEESIETILQYITQKEEGRLQHVFVMGCLSERYKKDLQKEIPEVDAYFGVNHISEIIHIIGGIYKKELIYERYITTPSHYAYLKIAEGCDRRCSFCAIPGIRGKHVSKPIEHIMQEAKSLSQKGVKELLLIAQDLTYYGLDIYKKQALPELVKQLSDAELFPWIRLHYLYPTTFPETLLSLIAERENICNYIDIPLQHVNSRILKSMHRGIDKKGTVDLIHKFRHYLPDAAIRTSFIVGYPNETEEEYMELLDFVKEMRFDRVGVFTYSPEENTPAFKLKDNVPEQVKQQRAAEIMQIQENISFELNQEKVGQTLDVLIDREEGEYYVGRTAYDSPEVDNEVLIKKEYKLQAGAFYKAKVISADSFDLYASVVK